MFITNLTLRGVKSSDVAKWFREHERRAYVSAEVDGCVIVCDAECEDQDIGVLAELGAALSEDLRCATLASLVHDSDVLVLMLFEAGERTMDYNSAPAYFEDSDPLPPAGADAVALCSAFRAACVDEVSRTLNQWNDPDAPDSAQDDSVVFDFEEERLKRIAQLLAVSSVISQVSYSLLDEEGTEHLGDQCPAFQQIE